MSIIQPTGQLVQNSVAFVAHHFYAGTEHKWLDQFVVFFRNSCERVTPVIQPIESSLQLGGVTRIDIKNREAVLLRDNVNKVTDFLTGFLIREGNNCYWNQLRLRVITSQTGE